MNRKYDAVIIGAGQAGPSLAGRLTAVGQTVALIERNLFGGTCVNTGCVPTKMLVASAHTAHVARHAEEMGVIINGSISVDMKKVKARKDALINKYENGIHKWLDDMEGCTVYQGTASFTDPHTIQVNDETITGKQIFINVGARAVVPDISGLDQIDYFTNSNVLDIDFLPKHLIIVGGSYIGLEFAQMYRRFGSEVTIIERGDRPIPREDVDISDAIQKLLEEDGIDFRGNADCTAFEKRGNDIVCKLDCKENSKEIIGSHVLLAVGRQPNTDDLGLEKAGVKTNDRGIVEVDDELRTNVSHIWALGECNGKGAFTHTSYNDYEIVAANLLDNNPRRVSDRIIIYGLFIDPPLGRVGMTEAQARAAGKKILVAHYEMSQIKRAIIKNETHGFMKVVIDAEDNMILGAAIFGVEGDELIHLFADMMYAKAPYTIIKNAVHAHPTVAELIPTMLGTLKEPD